jgi:Zn-dependent protease
MRITIDPLLPLVVIFMAWVLSERYFPQIMFTHTNWVYWAMGVTSSIFLTLSIFFHEYGHALAARWLKLPLERIHLYLFGGMAELKQRPVRPVEELIIALAGPLASLIFAGIAWAAAEYVRPTNYEAFLVLQFVFYMNLLLCGFNLLPIFPLDGGRTLRAVIWHVRKYFYKASIITFYISIAFILLIMVLAVVLLVIEGISTAFWAALLSGYLWYTAYTGRDELIYRPKFEDLIFRISPGKSPVSIIRQINRMDARYLRNAVIPVTEDGQLRSVVMGRELKGVPEADENISHLYRPVENGYFVDVADESTYRQGVKLKAEFLPVLQDGLMLGMSDAHEIRFWLLQQKHPYFPPRPNLTQFE